MSKSALLIVNPNSSSGHTVELGEGIAMLERAGFEVIRKESGSREDVSQLIGEYRNRVDVVIFGGGDGTISSAAEAFYRHGATLAVLPLGTANDLGRSLGLSGDLHEAFQSIVDDRRRRISLGVVNGRYFFNVANIGLGVRVNRALKSEDKRRLGVFSYLIAVFSALRKNSRFRVNIDIDGERHRLRSIHLAVGNGRFYGGGNVIHEDASIFDGRLRLFSIKPQWVWKLLAQAPLLRDGRHREVEGVFHASGGRVEVSASPGQEVFADGEPVTRTPAVFEVIPEAIEVIVPVSKLVDEAAVGER